VRNNNVLDVSSVELGEKFFAQLLDSRSMSAGASGLWGGVLSQASSKYCAYADRAANPAAPKLLPTKKLLRSIPASVFLVEWVATNTAQRALCQMTSTIA